MSAHKSKSPGETLASLFAFDKIRWYKLIEMCQFVVVFLVIGVPASAGISLVFESSPEHVRRLSMWRVYAEFAAIACLIVVSFFYIVKIAKVVPSLMSALDADFMSHTTIEYTVHIVLIVILIEMNDAFLMRLMRIKSHLLPSSPSGTAHEPVTHLQQ